MSALRQAVENPAGEVVRSLHEACRLTILGHAPPLEPKDGSGPRKPLVGVDRQRVECGGYIGGVRIKDQFVSDGADNPKDTYTSNRYKCGTHNVKFFGDTMPKCGCDVFDESAYPFLCHGERF